MFREVILLGKGFSFVSQGLGRGGFSYRLWEGLQGGQKVPPPSWGGLSQLCWVPGPLARDGMAGCEPGEADTGPREAQDAQ